MNVGVKESEKQRDESFLLGGDSVASGGSFSFLPNLGIPAVLPVRTQPMIEIGNGVSVVGEIPKSLEGALQFFRDEGLKEDGHERGKHRLMARTLAGVGDSEPLVIEAKELLEIRKRVEEALRDELRELGYSPATAIRAAAAEAVKPIASPQPKSASRGLFPDWMPGKAFTYHHVVALVLGSSAYVAPANAQPPTPIPHQVNSFWNTSLSAPSYFNTATQTTIPCCTTNIYRGPKGGSPYSSALASGLTGQSYQDTAVTAGATYGYTVASVDANGNVSPQSTPESDATIPTNAIALSAITSISANGVTVTYTDDLGNKRTR